MAWQAHMELLFIQGEELGVCYRVCPPFNTINNNVRKYVSRYCLHITKQLSQYQ